MHLDVRAASRLEDLDMFLRNVWLECCGHMSAFTIQGKAYTSGEKGMNTRLYTVFKPGMEFYYEYDFGTTTALRTGRDVWIFRIAWMASGGFMKRSQERGTLSGYFPFIFLWTLFVASPITSKFQKDY